MLKNLKLHTARMEDSMKARQLAICDNDNNYLKMLQAYLQKKNPADFEILIFNTVQQAVEASHKTAFEIFLIGEKIYDESVIKVNASKVFVLQEDGFSGITGFSMVAKYQSMEKLIAQVLEGFALDDSCSSIGRCGKNKTSLFSFYSPDRHRGQSIAALAAAQVMAGMGHKVLYLNLLPFTGFEELLGIEYDSDITDFMYFVLNHSDKLLYKLDSMKRTLHGVDYLPPVLDYTDLLRIGKEDWERVMDTLLYSSDYTDIVIDLAETCEGFYHIMEQSDKVYVLTDDKSIYGQAALIHYKKLLQAKEYDTILKHSVEFTLVENWEQQCDRLDNIAFSSIGACMKGVLYNCEGTRQI